MRKLDKMLEQSWTEARAKGLHKVSHTANSQEGQKQIPRTKSQKSRAATESSDMAELENLLKAIWAAPPPPKAILEDIDVTNETNQSSPERGDSRCAYHNMSVPYGYCAPVSHIPVGRHHENAQSMVRVYEPMSGDVMYHHVSGVPQPPFQEYLVVPPAYQGAIHSSSNSAVPPRIQAQRMRSRQLLTDTCAAPPQTQAVPPRAFVPATSAEMAPNQWDQWGHNGYRP
jgi:hypothetical protein